MAQNSPLHVSANVTSIKQHLINSISHGVSPSTVNWYFFKKPGSIDSLTFSKQVTLHCKLLYDQASFGAASGSHALTAFCLRRVASASILLLTDMSLDSHFEMTQLEDAFITKPMR